jgi:hypothetical protein
MVLGFIIIRNVRNKITDLYWKECYTCIRKWYTENPILIIDDSSDLNYLKENIITENCTTIHDTTNKGVAELLPYYYFHKLRPFDTAVVIHDSVFIQSKVKFELKDGENIRYLWTFDHKFNSDVSHHITKLLTVTPGAKNLIDTFKNQEDKWFGCFGVMSVIRLSFLDQLQEKYNIFPLLLSHVTFRDMRSALERVFALFVYGIMQEKPDVMFGDICAYIQWGLHFNDYLKPDFPYHMFPMVKVWSGR